MKPQNKYSQSHESSKPNKIYSKHTTSPHNISQNKPPVTFSPSLILRNTEYMTNLQNYLSIKRPYTQVEYDYLYEGIDPGSLCRIIVQNIYLLQICYLFKIKVYLSVNLYTDKAKYIPSTPNLNIFQLYCFQDQLNQNNQALKVKVSVLENRFIKIFDDQKNKIDDFFLVLDLMSKHIGEYLNCLKKIQKPASSTNSEVGQNRKYLSQFIKIYENIILVQKSRISQPKLLIKFLEQTKLFRSHSLLVKIINNTLFYSIKLFSRQLLSWLKFSTSEIRKFFIYQSGQIKYEKSVVNIIDNFFTKLCMLNVIEITKSLKGMNEQQESMNKDTLSLFDYENLVVNVNPTITASILVPEQGLLMMGPELFEHIIGNIPLQIYHIDDMQVALPKNLQIQISYTYTTNDIYIKCITDIDVLIYNMDYLNYLIASFNEGMKSTLVVDTIEKFRRSMNKKIQKVIAFKLMYKAKPNQQPLTKILQLIDVGVLASKIFMTELSKKSFIKIQDYQKREKVCQVFRHYENTFRNLMRKFYADLKIENLSFIYISYDYLLFIVLLKVLTNQTFAHQIFIKQTKSRNEQNN